MLFPKLKKANTDLKCDDDDIDHIVIIVSNTSTSTRSIETDIIMGVYFGRFHHRRLFFDRARPSSGYPQSPSTNTLHVPYEDDAIVPVSWYWSPHDQSNCHEFGDVYGLP